MELLDRLLVHDDWATRELLDACVSLTDEQLDQPFDIGHRTLRRTFAHMFFNFEAWTAAMKGLAEPASSQPADQRHAALEEWHHRSHAEFADLARRIRDDDRQEDTFVDFYGGPMTFGGAILHVILHDDEHRSEALHILERLGVTDLPEVDHGLWDFKRRGF